MTDITEAVLIKAARDEEFWTDERCYITEICNTPHLPASSLALARVESGVTTQLHSLAGITETYIIHSGHGALEAGGQMMQVHAGDQVVIPPGCPQRITAQNGELQFYCLCTPRFAPEAYINLED